MPNPGISFDRDKNSEYGNVVLLLSHVEGGMTYLRITWTLTKQALKSILFRAEPTD